MWYKIMYWGCSSKSVFGISEASDMCFANCSITPKETTIWFRSVEIIYIGCSNVLNTFLAYFNVSGPLFCRLFLLFVLMVFRGTCNLLRLQDGIYEIKAQNQCYRRCT
jgi:hypothetical protein